MASPTHTNYQISRHTNRHVRRLSIVVAIGCVAVFMLPVSHAAELRTVALTGQPAPGTPEGIRFASFGTHYIGSYGLLRGPVLNDAGQAAFRANLSGDGVDFTNNQGIWSEGLGSLSLLARTGNQAPGMPDGVNYVADPAQELFWPVINDAGQAAFYGAATGGGMGLWTGAPGSVELVAGAGNQAPGMDDGVTFNFAVLRDIFGDMPRLNDVGQTSFWAYLRGNGINNTNDWSVWSQGSGSTNLVARSGNAAPGTPDGVNYDGFITNFALNDAGQTAIYAYVIGSGVNHTNDQGIWSEGSGGLSLIARTGNQAPGTPEGVKFEQFFATVALNNAGQTAFEAWLSGDGVDETNDDGLWLEGSGGLELVARRGSPAPGTPNGVNFDAFAYSSYQLLNDDGEVAFRGFLTGTGVNSSNDHGIWFGPSNELTLVARTGSPAAGISGNVRFAEVHLPALNNAGQVAFRGNLTGSGVNSSNNRGIWATDQGGALQLVARTGSMLEVAPGDIRTLSDLDFVSASGNSDGRASGFNDLGQLVFWGRFTNGTQGVFVSDLVASLQLLPGDFNNNGVVDAADFTVWRDHLGTAFDLGRNREENGGSAGVVDQADYALWKAHFGETLESGTGVIRIATVPEPASLFLAIFMLVLFIVQGRRRTRAHGRLALLVAVVALSQSAASRASTIESDANATSAFEVTFDPDESFEGRGTFVTGRLPTYSVGPLVGTDINSLVGADAFYSQGYTGTNAVIANIEMGHIWSGHETLTHVEQMPLYPGVLGEFDRHATWVGMILGGRQGGVNPGTYQEGLAPGAQLYSGATATQWNGPRLSLGFDTTNAATFDPYRRAFSTGVNTEGRRADVINSSWGNTDATNGSSTVAIALDGFAITNPHTLLVAAAGNEGPGPDKVITPAAGYNNISVAALGPNPPYDRPASFSSGGPNDYVDPVNGTKNNARQVVDIAAPGQNLSSAYYGGETGGNGTTDNRGESGPGPTGLPFAAVGGPDFYSRGRLEGTSVAAPIVAGGAALLYDAAYAEFSDNDDARDARVIKAVLMNSADKTFGWNNGQVAHPNGNGGVRTTQGLNNRVGTGRMNLTAAYDQFLTGTTDVEGTSGGNLGLVDWLGWDLGEVVSGTTNDYFFDSPLEEDSTFTATLTWFRDRRINDNNTVIDESYDDLNLELWSVEDGIPTSLISESSSLYNNSEHFSFALPFTGDYALRVRWFDEVFDRVADADQEFYGLAWWAGAGLTVLSIPEPASLGLVIMAAVAYGTCVRLFRKHRLNY